jgi:hypothetical protein
MPNFSSEYGGSSNPVQGGNIHYATVVKVVSGGEVYVNVPALGLTSQNTAVLNDYSNSRLRVGERVICAFVDGGKSELVVLGPVNRKFRAFPTYSQYEALLDRVEELEGLVTALQTQLNVHTHN